MSDAADRLLQSIDRYLAGGQPYMEFWSTFMDIYNDGGLSDSEALAYEPAYDLVYMGSDDEVAPEDQAVGVLPEPVLKARLLELRGRL